MVRLHGLTWRRRRRIQGLLGSDRIDFSSDDHHHLSPLHPPPGLPCLLLSLCSRSGPVARGSHPFRGSVRLGFPPCRPFLAPHDIWVQRGLSFPPHPVIRLIRSPAMVRGHAKAQAQAAAAKRAAGGKGTGKSQLGEVRERALRQFSCDKCKLGIAVSGALERTVWDESFLSVVLIRNSLYLSDRCSELQDAHTALGVQTSQRPHST